MRIISLLPSTTELCAALGLLDCLVGVTHECDYPPAVRALPQVTRSLLPPGLDHAAIDRAVRERVAAGQPLYALDWETIAALRPDLILTQALCPVCAVSYEDVCALAAGLPGCQPQVLAVEPHTLSDVLDAIAQIGAVTNRRAVASAVQAAIQQRIDGITAQCTGLPEHPRVVCLEWLDPPFLAGHWVPEMIERAGGIDPIGLPGRPSFTIDWDTIARADPDVLVVMPCGYDAPTSAHLAQAYWPTIERAAPRAVAASRVYAVDASSYFSRPGPRLVTGLALLAHLLHPEAVPPPADAAAAVPVTASAMDRVS